MEDQQSEEAFISKESKRTSYDRRSFVGSDRNIPD